ncbi:ZP domain-containing protein-like [Exaiptasia diaphana]|uniref:ZP domain-containing protein n=1 Tax=Exaiptasia diaphana TaxID=2652724 RepID=A0A913XC33_EXADI|nr:ZP domain-containing protein-like [Exaiptasia diaphana]
MDSTMIYRYYPSSSVQRFSIKSFRFLRTSKRLVYLHCELLVCHRNSTNSRCSSGCVGSRRRRDTDDYDDTSNSYGLSTGPIAGDKIDLSETDQNKGTEHKVQGMTIGLSVMGGVLALVCVAVIMKLVHAKVLKSRKSRSASAYEVKTNEGSAASNLDDCPTEHAVNAYDGPAAFQLDEIAKP